MLSMLWTMDIMWMRFIFDMVFDLERFIIVVIGAMGHFRFDRKCSKGCRPMQTIYCPSLSFIPITQKYKL